LPNKNRASLSLPFSRFLSYPSRDAQEGSKCARPRCGQPRTPYRLRTLDADNAKFPRRLFTQTVRDMLSFPGSSKCLSQLLHHPGNNEPPKSRQPPNPPGLAPPLKTGPTFVALGNLTPESATGSRHSPHGGRRSQHLQRAVVGQVYRGVPPTAKYANRPPFADESLQTFRRLPRRRAHANSFVSSRTGTKEVWVMDYDGATARYLSGLPSLSRPRWSPGSFAYRC